MELPHLYGLMLYPMQQVEQPHVWQLMYLFVVADGMATFVTGWCYCHCGRWNGHWLEYFQGRSYHLGGRCYGHWVIIFNFSSVLLTRTSSHVWGRWYLPMFLFGDGLLTLINIDSLISLERFCSSLPTILKLLSGVEWPVMLLWSNIGEGAFRCSLNSTYTNKIGCYGKVNIFLYTTWSPCQVDWWKLVIQEKNLFC